MKLRILILSLLLNQPGFSQLKLWQKGMVKEGFIFEKASFPESHAATIAETPKGLVAAWFGGTKERNPDVCIWISRKGKTDWSAPQNVANGIINDTLRYACWNPVLYQVPDGELLLFYKVGPSPAKWKGWLKTSKDAGLTWSDAKALPEGFIGPVKNKPVLLSDGTLLSPTSTEGEGWKVHFEASKRWRQILAYDRADQRWKNFPGHSAQHFTIRRR